MLYFCFTIEALAIAKTTKMKDETKKIRKKKETKKNVSVSTIKKLEKVTLGYGKLRDFADKASLDYNTVHSVRTTGMATATTLQKISKALQAAA